MQEKNKQEKISISRRFLNIRSLIIFILAISFLLFIFMRFNIDFGSMFQRLKDCDPLPYFLAYVIYYAGFPLRGWRWKILLKNARLDKDKDVVLPSSWQLSRIILLSWFANCILYARLGDVYRAYLIKEEANASFSRTLGTVVAERIIDIFVVFILLLITGLSIWGLKMGKTTELLLVVGFTVLIILMAILFFMWRFGSKLEKRLPVRFRYFYTVFQEGTLGSFRQLIAVIPCTVAIWLTEAGRLYLVTLALHISISPQMAIFVAIAYALMSALPLTPGGLGLVEPGMSGILMITLTREDAWATTLVDRTISFLSIIAIGLMVFIYREINKKYSKTAKPA